MLGPKFIKEGTIVLGAEMYSLKKAFYPSVFPWSFKNNQNGTLRLEK